MVPFTVLDNVGSVENATPGEDWIVSVTPGVVHLLVNDADHPDYNADYVLSPEAAKQVGMLLIAAANKAKPRKRYRML